MKRQLDITGDVCPSISVKVQEELGGVQTGDLLEVVLREKDLKDIREKLDPLVQKECPFKTKPETNAPVTWVSPELVCEVSLSGWTEDVVMRQPVFVRLREDKAPREVVRERPLGRAEGRP